MKFLLFLGFSFLIYSTVNTILYHPIQPGAPEGSLIRYRVFHTSNDCLSDKLSKILRTDASGTDASETDVSETDVSEENQCESFVAYLQQGKKFSKKDLLGSMILSIMSKKSLLLSHLLENKGVDIHAKTQKFYAIECLSPMSGTEYHFKWHPLCFALLNWNEQIMGLLVQKGATTKDVSSSKGFYKWMIKIGKDRQITDGIQIISDLQNKSGRQQGSDATERMPLLWSD